MDRASYEAGFRAAQQAPQQDNSFLNALGVGALGAGAGIAYGRRRDIKKGLQSLLARDKAVDQYVKSRKERPTGVTVTNLSDVDVDSVKTAAKYKPNFGAEESNFPVQTSYVEDQKVRGASDASIAGAGDIVNRGLANDQLGGASPEQVGPSQEQRSQVYQEVAAKPVSDLPPVSRPQGGIDPGTITDPNTGEIFSPGQSPSTAKSVDANQIATEQLAKKVDDLKDQIRADKQEAKLDKAVEKLEQATENVRSRDFLKEQLQTRGYVAPETTPSSGFKQFSQEADQVSRQAGGVVATDAPKSSAPVASQAVEALDTGADQQAMRVSRTVQRDPNENLAEFETVQDSLEQSGASPVQAADAAVAVTEGTPAFTQTDAPVQGPLSAQDTADAALQEMMTRRSEIEATGLKPGTTRFERALAQPFRTSSSVSPRMTGEAMTKTALPAGSIRQSVQGVSDVESLPERSVLNVGPEAIVTKTAMGTAIRGASPVLHEAPQVNRQRQVFGGSDVNVTGAIDESMPDRPARETALSQILTQPQERVDPYAVAQQERGGSAGIGVYGIEPSYVPGAQSKLTGLMSAASERKPTEARQTALDKLRNPFSQLSDQELGEISMTGAASEAELYNVNKELIKRRSIDASRKIQQLQKSGRPDAQQLVQKYLQELRGGI